MFQLRIPQRLLRTLAMSILMLRSPRESSPRKRTQRKSIPRRSTPRESILPRAIQKASTPVVKTADLPQSSPPSPSPPQQGASSCPLPLRLKSAQATTAPARRRRSTRRPKPQVPSLRSPVASGARLSPPSPPLLRLVPLRCLAQTAARTVTAKSVLLPLARPRWAQALWPCLPSSLL